MQLRDIFSRITHSKSRWTSAISHIDTSQPPREISSAEAPEAAATLADSFTNDAVVRYYLRISDCDRPLKAREAKLHLRMYECLTAATCYNGLVISAGPRHDSVGLWLPPGSDWNWKTYWRSGMWSLWLRLGREGRKRFFGSWDTFDNAMKSIMGERASSTWILMDLGTKKSSRCQGYAKEVMRYGLELAERQSQPAYVECFEYNVKFYENFGFQKKGEVSLDRVQPPIVLQAMVRYPRVDCAEASTKKATSSTRKRTSHYLISFWMSRVITSFFKRIRS